MTEGQKYRGGGPGRLDVNGVEWWACDPYPTWYRWEGSQLFTDPAGWPDEAPDTSCWSDEIEDTL